MSKYQIDNFYQRVRVALDSALEEVVSNVQDVNTSDSKARKITLNIEIKPRERRSVLGMGIQAKTTLAPREVDEVSLLAGQDLQTGEIVLGEYAGQMLGQVTIDDAPVKSFAEFQPSEPDLKPTEAVVDMETGEVTRPAIIDLRRAQQN